MINSSGGDLVLRHLSVLAEARESESDLFLHPFPPYLPKSIQVFCDDSKDDDESYADDVDDGCCVEELVAFHLFDPQNHEQDYPSAISEHSAHHFLAVK